MKTLKIGHIAPEERLITDLKRAIACQEICSINDIESENDICNATRQKVFRNKASIEGYLSSLNIQEMTEVNLMNKLGLVVNFWFCPNNGKNFNLATPRIVRSFTPSNPRSELNLLVDRNNFDIDNPRSFTSGLQILIDIRELKDILLKQKSFIECAEDFANARGSFQGLWPADFDLFDERSFAQRFNFGFEIYVVDARFCQVKKEVVTCQKQIHKSVKRNRFMTLEYVGDWNSDKDQIFSTDRFILRQSKDFEKFSCPNDWCHYNTTKIQDYNIHINSCSNQTTVKYKRICLVDEDAKSYLKRRKLLPADYENFNFVSFDIETLSLPQHRQTGEYTTCIGKHQLVSIALTSNFGEERDTVFMRSDFSEASLNHLMSEFWGHLKNLQIAHLNSLPKEIDIALETIEHERAGQHPFENGKLYSAKRYLHNLRKLKVVSFNGERYDLPIIFPALLKFLNIKKSTSKSTPLDVVKRGNGMMSLDHCGIKFSDVRNFFPYGSLDQMGKIFQVEVHKLAFPYEAYTTIGELEEATDWPPYSAFHSSLSQFNDVSNINEKLHQAFVKAEQFFNMTCHDFFEQLDVFDAFVNYRPCTTFPLDLRLSDKAESVFNLDPILYVESWIKFEELKILGEVQNMGDYLKHYNLCDTKVTTSAFEKMVKLFSDKFGENLLEYPSLPGVAYQVLWNHFSIKVNKPYTIGEQFGWISKAIREAILGGLVSVFHCHCECGDVSTQYSDAVHYAMDGRRYRAITGYDAANLYGYSMMGELPVGQGILYKKQEDGQFSVQLMSDNRNKPKSRHFSKAAISWLSWCQNGVEFRDVKIEHALNGGERTITLEKTTFSPDGYCEIDNVSHYFQFEGCHWHDHDCETSRNSQRVKDDPEFQKRCELINQLCSKHGILHTMKECDWSKIKTLNSIENTFCIFLERNRVSETELLQAICDNKVFGLVKCSVKSPAHVIERYMKVNYPPLIRKVSPDSTMIDPEIKKHLAGKKIAENQLTQVYFTLKIFFDYYIDVSC